MYIYMFVIALIWAVTVTFFLLYRNPLPFPDKGHRCFAVSSERAAKVVVTILGKAGLPERFTFSAGSTHQTLLWDNMTVIIRHDEQEPAPNGLSVVTSDPKASAMEAVTILGKAGFTATIQEDVIPELLGGFVLLTSNAFDGWSLIFRRHIMVLGNPPNKRKLLK